MGNEEEVMIMGTFIRLVDYGTAEKESEFRNKENYYVFDIRENNRIPASPIVYQANEKILGIFERGKLLEELAIVRNGMKTGANEKFIRLWWEVSNIESLYDAKCYEEAIDSGRKWFPYNKGGSPRKWYGNNDYVVNWEAGGKRVIGEAKKDKRNVQDYPNELKFKPSVTWSLINTNAPTFRLKQGSISDIAGMSFYNTGENTNYLLGLCNSIISTELLKMIAPTMNYQAGDIARIPVSIERERKSDIEQLVENCIDISKKEWDSYEVSWGFVRNPLINGENTILQAFEKYNRSHVNEAEIINRNEQKIDSIFLDIYGLDKKVLGVNDSTKEIQSINVFDSVSEFISYVVGCILGRYSLKEDGLIYAGGEWDESKYSDDFKPCEYGIMPITENQYFGEDLCTRVIDFIKIVYGEDTLNDNLKFIAKALKPDSYEAPKKIIRDYLFNGFFDNHYQIYQHRPIYWQLDSGKAGGFRAIMYMHRFNENTLSTVRTEYIQELRYKYEDELQRLQHKLGDANTTAEKNDVKKQATAIDKKLVECTVYDDLLNHVTGSIQNYVFDLDDGVKTNYAKFLSIDGDKTKNVLTVIKL